MTKTVRMTRGLMRALPFVFLSALVPNSAAAQRSTYVIVHGAWGGAWDWRTVDSLLSTAGHEVHRVQLTGLGSLVHLSSPAIGLTTHIEDVVNAIQWEGLTDVTLLGHSYGGMVITGVADRIPERLREVVYLDAFLPNNGESAWDVASTAMESRWRSFLREDGFLYVPGSSTIPGNVPHPAKTFTDRIELRGTAAPRRATYILTIQPAAPTPDDFQHFADRATARGWRVIHMEADHVPERSAPEDLVKLLLTLR